MHLLDQDREPNGVGQAAFAPHRTFQGMQDFTRSYKSALEKETARRRGLAVMAATSLALGLFCVVMQIFIDSQPELSAIAALIKGSRFWFLNAYLIVPITTLGTLAVWYLQRQTARESGNFAPVEYKFLQLFVERPGVLVEPRTISSHLTNHPHALPEPGEYLVKYLDEFCKMGLIEAVPNGWVMSHDRRQALLGLVE